MDKQDKILKVTDGHLHSSVRLSSNISLTQLVNILRAKYYGKNVIALDQAGVTIPIDLILKDDSLDFEKEFSIVFENEELDNSLKARPIGYIKSCFPLKNGTPRQGNLAPDSRAILKILPVGNVSATDSIIGLSSYSHLWLIFWFHNNGSYRFVSKVYPPRLNGQSVGVYSTRSPHRYNPIGLTLAKIESIHDDIIELSGVDLIDGTPVIDIKPYIHKYDTPLDDWYVANWVEEPTPISKVVFEPNTEKVLETLQSSSSILNTPSMLKNTIEQVILSDPRSVYRKKKCEGQPFGFHVDMVNVQCKIEEGVAFVYNIEPLVDNKDTEQHKAGDKRSDL